MAGGRQLRRPVEPEELSLLYRSLPWPVGRRGARPFNLIRHETRRRVPRCRYRPTRVRDYAWTRGKRSLIGTDAAGFC
jgi:hypothetical protein